MNHIKYDSSKEYPKLVTLLLIANLAILSLIIFVFLIKATPVQGYELSFYKNIPSYSWLFLILPFILSSIILLFFSSKNSSGIIDSYFLIGLLLLFLISLILLITPVLKYSKLYDRWDAWYHLAHTFDIIKLGRVNLHQNSYPALHLLAVFLENTSGMEVLNIYKYIFPILFSLNILFIYVLIKNISSKDIIIICAIITTVIPGVHTVGLIAKPWVFSLLLIPLIIYLYFSNLKKGDKRYLFFLILLFLVIPIFHVLIAMIIICILLVFELLRKLINHQNGRINEKLSTTRSFSMSSLIVFTIATISGILILIYCYEKRFFSVIDVLLQEQFQFIAGPNFTTLNIIKFFLPELILVSIFAFGVFITVHKTFGKKHIEFLDLVMFMLLGYCIINAALLLISLFIPILPFKWNRPLSITFIILPVGVSISIYNVLQITKKRLISSNKNALDKKIRVIIIFLLTMAFVAGLTTLYPSPYTFRLNYQNTDMECSAVWWLGTYKNMSKKVLTDQSLSRYTAYLNASEDNWRSGYWGFLNTIPTHLGYGKGNVDHTVMRNRYLLLSQFVIIKGESGYIPNWQLSKEDLQKLHNDIEINKIYDNGESYSFLIFTLSITHTD